MNFTRLIFILKSIFDRYRYVITRFQDIFERVFRYFKKAGKLHFRETVIAKPDQTESKL